MTYVFFFSLSLYIRIIRIPIICASIIISSSMIAQALYNSYNSYRFTFMINPAGNVTSTERVINDGFERSITMRAADYLQSYIEQEFPDTRVLITRSPGQVTGALHNAQCANSLGVTLFISLHFYHEHRVKPHVYLYQFSYNNQLKSKASDFSFYRYHQSYFFNHASSAHAAHILTELWSRTPYTDQFITHTVIGFPCAPLIGITVPALALDIGIKESLDWQTYIPALIDGIKAIRNAAIQASTKTNFHYP